MESDSKRLKKDEDYYNREFVKMILDSAKRGDYKVDPKDVWRSLGLK